MDIAHRVLRGIDEKRRLDGSYRPVTALEIVTRCLSAVEVGGIDGGVSPLVEQLRRESEQLAPDAVRCSVVLLTEDGWAGDLAALDLLGPVEDFDECRFHMKLEKMQDSVLQAGNSVAGGMTDLHYRCISRFSCYREGLFDEAEENLLHKDASSASFQSS